MAPAYCAGDPRHVEHTGENLRACLDNHRVEYMIDRIRRLRANAIGYDKTVLSFLDVLGIAAKSRLPPCVNGICSCW